VGVAEGVHDGLVRLSEELMPRAAMAFRHAEDFLVAPSRDRSAFDPGHRSFSCPLRIRHQPAHASGGDGRYGHLARDEPKRLGVLLWPEVVDVYLAAVPFTAAANVVTSLFAWMRLIRFFCH